ncbi:MAG: type II toxin-antitoxin system HicB family antitoxin [Gammaproteobacteria bacterium]|nr:type II toxin-antitoxin system HicB family antitoxin [Gammaproteobacteria bacterium]
MPQSLLYTYWQTDDPAAGAYLGYLDDYPEYITQGESLADLQAHLRDIHREIIAGNLPGLRRRGTLQVA